MIYFNSTPLIRVYLALPLIPSSFLAPDCIFLYAFSTLLSVTTGPFSDLYATEVWLSTKAATGLDGCKVF